MATITTRESGNEGARRRPQNVSGEAAILDRMVKPDQPTFSPEAARALLEFDFDPIDKEQMRQLSAKAREGTLTPEEQDAINNYERVGHFINLLQSKVRRSFIEN